ncbi:hypothetical protein U0070_020915, partial [Myodes glareolus]
VVLTTKPMERVNCSLSSEFVFLGLTNSWDAQLLLFVFSSVLYLASMMGNCLIVFTVASDHHLHSPMYFLLSILSLVDVGISSATSPKMIYDLFKKHKVISFRGCVTQIFFIHAIGGVEMVLLIAMAFDRYVAICKPLHYLTLMSPKMCIFFLITALVVGPVHSVIQLVFIVNLPLCGPNIGQLLLLELLVSFNSGFMSVCSFIILIISYIVIIFTVRKHSSSGSSKALSTLSAHVTVVVLFFGPAILFYTWPSSSAHLDKFLALFDAVVTPFLNPLLPVFYMASMMGNSLIIFTVASDPHLHSPMYLLLANLSFINLEVVLLIGMAYDRYVAICKPLHYLTIMNAKKCIFILVSAWVVGLMHSLVQFVYV